MKRRFYLCHARCIWWRRPASSKSRVRRPWGCLRWSSCLPRCGLSRLATCRNLARWRCRPGKGSEISKMYEHDYKSNQGILTNIHAPVINITYTIFEWVHLLNHLPAPRCLSLISRTCHGSIWSPTHFLSYQDEDILCDFAKTVGRQCYLWFELIHIMNLNLQRPYLTYIVIWSSDRSEETLTSSTKGMMYLSTYLSCRADFWCPRPNYYFLRESWASPPASPRPPWSSCAASAVGNLRRHQSPSWLSAPESKASVSVPAAGSRSLVSL